MALTTSIKSKQFTESVIREMTRLYLTQQSLPDSKPGVNLAQGFPDFPAPYPMKEAAVEAIRGDINQYAITWGSPSLRRAISENTARFYGALPDPDREITVTCGATEAMMAVLMALVDPGDEVIVFEPFYENYSPDSILVGASPRYITLHEPDWSFDPAELEAAFNNKTRAIIINTPNNPTGKVFSQVELSQIATLCQKWNVAAVTDEIYEHMVYSGKHIRMADMPGMRGLTVTISGLSKTYSATGWRIGWVIATPEVTSAVRKVHDFLTVGAAAPLQEGASHALGFEDAYYTELAASYLVKRDVLMNVLKEVGFTVYEPHGAYYIMTDIKALGWSDDVEFARQLIDKLGIATVPGSSFYREPKAGRTKIRFCFCKRPETLKLAEALLRRLPEIHL